MGRERDNDVVLLDPKISRYHAHISVEAEQWTLTDLGSSNHTYLNGQIVTAPTALQTGDRIRIGETELTFKTPGRPAVDTLPVRKEAPSPADMPVAPVRRSAPPRLA